MIHGWPLLLTAVLAQPPMPDVDTAPDAQKSWQFVWAGVQANFDKLQNGVYRASGRVSTRVEEGNGPNPKYLYVSGEESIYSAFDYPNSRIRFDRSGPMISNLPKAGPDGKTYKVITVEAKICYHPDKSIYQSMGRRMVYLNKADYEAPRILHYYDLRTVGLIDLPNWEKGITYRAVVDAYSKNWRSSHVVVNRVYQFTQISKNVRQQIWFDPDQGFMPIRFEISAISQKNDGSFEKPYSASTASWINVDGVWVPKTWVCGEYDPTGENGMKRQHELAFEWESVNKSIPDRLFDYTSFGLPPDALIQDLRFGKPVLTTIGGMQLPVRAEEELQGVPVVVKRIDGSDVPVYDMSPHNVPRPSSWSTSRVIKMASVPIMVLMVVALYMRRRRPSRPVN
jgi:hypothetical protein